jgi:uncharacterized BrkB/YihY/UPF0761 family membrane protein
MGRGVREAASVPASEPQPATTSARARATARGQRLQARALGVASRAPGYEAAAAAMARDTRNGGGLLAGALAFRLFGALLPLALLAAVLLGYASTVEDSNPEEVADAVGLKTALLESVAESSRLSGGTRWTVTAFAVVALVWSATSAARAIRAVHSLAWEGGVARRGRAVQAGLVLIVTLFAFALVWAIVGGARSRLGDAGLIVAFGAVVLFFAIWLGVSMLLPHGDAPWTALLPGALVVAAGMQLTHLGTVLFLGGRVERASATYGSLGVAFTLLLWLFVVSRVIVASAMLNAALWERRSGRPPAPRPGAAGSSPPAASARP